MGASVTIRRRVEWIDTDAAGIWHYTTTFRFAEAAEAELHRRLGIVRLTFGATPRARLEIDFHAPLGFDDEIDVSLRVDDVGRTSVRYSLEIAHGGAVAVTGSVVTVFVDRDTRRPRPWPDQVRAALADGVPTQIAG